MDGCGHRPRRRGTVDPVRPSELLAFEAAHPGWSSNKEMRIRHELAMTPVRYAVLLERAAVSVEGMLADPITARRVRAPGRRTLSATY
ncbi:DUF3263 domain-containing protein [Microbacterium sp. 22303]|uniref:DUF3263 domain-containing protein n=1 Tax=Microbacterium sp. 22303 TaxID=3453905 RepID=UPI003F8516A1